MLTSLAWAEVTLDELTSLFHSGKYEQLVVEGELLGKRLQTEQKTRQVAEVYQMLTIAYMRLGRKDDMMRANAIAKGAFASLNEASVDPAEKRRAICQRASALFSEGDVEKTLAFCNEHLKDWPGDNVDRFYLIKPKFHATHMAQGLESALQGLEQDIAVLEGLLESDPANRKYHLANLGLSNLLVAEALLYEQDEKSLLYGEKAYKFLKESPEVNLSELPGGPNLGFRLAAVSGRYQQALQLHEEFRSNGGPGLGLYGFAVEARTGYWLEQAGESARAAERYLAAIDIIDGAWSKLKLRENKATLMAGDSKMMNWMPPGLVFEHAIALLLTQGDARKGLELSELFKSRSLRDALSHQELEKHSPVGVDQALLERERSLFQQLASRPEPETVREYLQVLDSIREQNPEYYSLLSGDPGQLRLPKLADDEILVEYFLGRSEAFIFLLESGGQVQVVRRPVGRESLEESVKEVRKAITRVQSDKAVKAKLFSLSQHLIAPIEGNLAGKKRVIFVPHGKLHYLPFASLLTQDGKYLVESFEVVEAPSAHSLSFGQDKNPRRKQGFAPTDAGTAVFALGDVKVGTWPGLPGTLTESATVVSTLPDAQAYTAEKMTRQAVLNGLNRSGILHFATHGFYEKGEPLESGIVTSDQAVTVADVLGQRMKAYSVFLSACETAVGEETGADEIVGLQQSFQYAGSPSVIATLWQISDEATTQLVADFYRELKTQPKGTALRIAQLKMLKGRYGHPFYWAPFVLSGDWI